MDWLKEDLNNIWHPYSPLTDEQTNLLIERGEGVHLITSDGRRIIDGISSWWVNIHGHSHPHLAKALFEQARTLEHVIFAGFTHTPAIQLSKNLLRILPGNQHKIFFSDNGSTAVEVALKMAIQYWHHQGIKKKRIVAMESAYHGDTFGAMAVGERGLFTVPFQDYLFETSFIPFPNDPRSTIHEFERLAKAGDVGAFIYEPLVQGAAGMRMYPEEVLEQLLQVANRYDVICIADEVFTGFGRTGKWFASDYVSIKPDLVCLSKGITGGTLPLGVTAASEKITAAFANRPTEHTFFHGHSYTANPLSCAVANASFELLMEPECTSSIHRISERHAAFIQSLNTNKLRSAKSLGTILSLEINSGATSYTNDIRKKIYTFFLDRNILLRPLGNVIYMVPPYIISDEELDVVYEAIREFLLLLE